MYCLATSRARECVQMKRTFHWRPSVDSPLAFKILQWRAVTERAGAFEWGNSDSSVGTRDNETRFRYRMVV
jgi:hypothetical protein